MWSTVRALVVTGLVIAALVVIVDDKAGMTKPFLHNPDLKPQRKTDTKFEHVKGVDEAKDELLEVVEYLKNPGAFTTLGGKLPKGVLLVGPPGAHPPPPLAQSPFPPPLLSVRAGPSILWEGSPTRTRPTNAPGPCFVRRRTMSDLHTHTRRRTRRDWQDDACACDCGRGRRAILLHKWLGI
jgi:hypothetical protein